MKFPFTKSYLAGYGAGLVVASLIAPYIVEAIDLGIRLLLESQGVQYGHNLMLDLPWYIYFLFSGGIAALSLGLRTAEYNRKPHNKDIAP